MIPGVLVHEFGEAPLERLAVRLPCLPRFKERLPLTWDVYSKAVNTELGASLPDLEVVYSITLEEEPGLMADTEE